MSRFYDNSNGNLSDWPISEDSRQRVTVAYRMKIVRTKKSTLYDVRTQRTFYRRSPRNLMRMIPGIAASWKAPYREIRRLWSISYFFFCHHKSDVNCSPEGNSMIEKVLQIALTYLSQLLYEVTRISSAHPHTRQKIYRSHIEWISFISNNSSISFNRSLWIYRSKTVNFIILRVKKKWTIVRLRTF